VLRKAADERLTALNAVTAAYQLVRKAIEERRAPASARPEGE
jgi:hypothetical protein